MYLESQHAYHVHLHVCIRANCLSLSTFHHGGPSRAFYILRVTRIFQASTILKVAAQTNIHTYMHIHTQQFTYTYIHIHIKCLALEMAGRKQSEVIFPFVDVCILYDIVPKRFTVNGKTGSPFFFARPSQIQTLY